MRKHDLACGAYYRNLHSSVQTMTTILLTREKNPLPFEQNKQK